VSFRMGDVFPADDPLSEWVATLAMAFNDIALIHERMIEDQDAHRRFFYWLRLAISHYAEAVDYLITTEPVEVVGHFRESLSDEAQNAYKECVERYVARESEIQQIRNVVGFHYPELRFSASRRRQRPMQQALTALAGETGRIKRDVIINARFFFADDVAATLFMRSTPTWDDVLTAHRDIVEGMEAFMRFGNPAITEFFSRAAAGGAQLIVTDD
jgi:hypothetical protein